jgi:hypothetical protein
MGFDIPKDITADNMGSGDVPWIKITDSVDNLAQGKEGVLNFYKFGEDMFKHVNVGVGTRGNETMNQIIDATEGGTMLNRNDGRSGQMYPAYKGEVNQTYAPLSSNDTPDAQGYIDWPSLAALRKGKK